MISRPVVFVTSLAFAALAHAQTKITATGQYYILSNGPTNQNNRLATVIRNDLHYYPNVSQSPNYNSENLNPFDTLLKFDLSTSKYEGTNTLVGLPKGTTAVRVYVKIKTSVARATWDGTGEPPLPAYVQADLSPAKLSELPVDQSDLAQWSVFSETHNHCAHAETVMWVPWNIENRVVRFSEVDIPVSYNSQGHPCIGFVMNYGNINQGSDGTATSLVGTSRGSCEVTIYLVGFYATSIKALTTIG